MHGNTDCVVTSAVHVTLSITHSDACREAERESMACTQITI